MGKLSELILRENIEVQVKVIGQNGEPVVAKYVGKDKADIYPQVIDGMDVPKANIKSMEVTNTNTEEDRGFKGNLDNGEFKEKEVDKKPVQIQTLARAVKKAKPTMATYPESAITTGGQTGITI